MSIARRLLAEAIGQVGQAVFEGAVEVADRFELGKDRAAHLVGRRGQRLRLGERGKALRVGHVHALRSLEVGEVAQGDLAEGHQHQLDLRRERARRDREVRAAQVRRGAHGGEQVLHQREVQHLLLGDVDELVAPVLHERLHVGGEALAGVLLERERGEEVLAEDEMLQLGGLAEDVDQRLAVLDADRRLGVDVLAADRQDVREPPTRSQTRLLTRHAPMMPDPCLRVLPV